MLSAEVIKLILQEYDAKCDTHKAFTTKLESLVKELLEENALRTQSITSRVKTRNSLQGKLTRDGAHYTALNDITDISGLRITTFYQDDVDKVAACLKSEFDIIEEHSVDKRQVMDPDRFGYLSLHYVVKVSADRAKLTEYKKFPHLCCEIQVRSILQHAWAEIEHDLGYKNEKAVPRNFRRRFARLAGLLELADEEFAQISTQLSMYQKGLAQQIIERANEVTIDKLSIKQFIDSDPLVKELDEAIASVFEGKVTALPGMVDSAIDTLGFFRVSTISELRSLLQEHKDLIPRFAKAWIVPGKEKVVGTGVCLFYLAYVLLGQSNNIGTILNFIRSRRIGPPWEHDKTANKVLTTYQALKQPPA